MIPQINLKKTGQNIKNLMKEHHLSVGDIQELCGITSKASIYKWFHGMCIPSTDNLVILADAFGCTLEDVLVVEK